MPLYSPDQLRIRHKLIPDVPLTSQVISLLEQMQQAAALKVALSEEQLYNANPLLGPKGAVQVRASAFFCFLACIRFCLRCNSNSNMIDL
jgi:hypothetical protein